MSGLIRVAEAHAVGSSPGVAESADFPWGAALSIAVVGLWYGLGFVRAHRTGKPTVRACAFASGLGVLAIALLGPLDRWATQSFAAHMVQHELLMLFAAPLLVLGRPLPMLLWAFPGDLRRMIGSGARSSPVRVFWGWLLSPAVAWLCHGLALWIWHAPRLFDDALRSPAVHDLQHLTFFCGALVFWASLAEERRRDRQGAGILYLFTTVLHTGVLGALITFATRLWYSPYLDIPSAWGMSALEDQQLGGLIMWIPGSAVYVAAALWLLGRWILQSDRTTQADAG